jgi:two-component system sensor histidine kinase SenX3
VTEPSGRRAGAPESGRRRRFPISPAPRGQDVPPEPANGGRPAPPGRASVEPAASDPGDDPAPTALPAETVRILRAVTTPVLWVDRSGAVLWAHPEIETMGVIRRGAIRVREVARAVTRARSTGEGVEAVVSSRRPGRRQPQIRLRVQVAPMDEGAVLVLVEDISEAERLDRVRRDFVANVSHELKTPIGALSLLAEAVVEAGDDVDAAQHFAARMIAETRRLTTLVNDLMDLSRLEGIDPQRPMQPVSVDDVVDQACDDARLLAEEHMITVVRGGVPELAVLGVEQQLVAGVRNLIINAINYSPDATKVAVTTGLSDGVVTIAVTDQGIGISPGELDRIFERFYRVDPARSRDTGGTGLGLAIVKHVCGSHGGDCDVWSRVGEGSTFTMRLPHLPEPPAPARRTPRRPTEEDR